MNEIERYVLEMIGEDPESPDVFTDDSDGMALIRESINDAIEEIVVVSGTNRRIYKMPMREAANFYRIEFKAGDFGWISGAWLFGIKKRLVQTDFGLLVSENPNWLQNSGTPEKYFIVGKNLFGVWPAPSTSNDFVEIDCIVIPERYSHDTDRLIVRDRFKWAVAHYAVGEYYASRGDAASAIEHHNDYLKHLGVVELQNDFAERQYGLGTTQKTN